jgi:hypothetical protein
VRAAAPATSGLAVRTSLGCSDGHITGASFRGGERDGGRDKHSASDWAVDPKLTAEDGEAVVERQEAASMRLGAADALVAYVDVKRAALDPRVDSARSARACFVDVCKRLGDHEVRGRLDGDR